MILVGSGTGTLGRQIVHGPLARGERVRAQRARHSDEQRCPWPAAPRRPGGSVGPGGGDRDLRLPFPMDVTTRTYGVELTSVADFARSRVL
jgi:hypothetical protein